MKQIGIIFLFLFSLFLPSAAQSIRYIPKHDELKYTFGGHPPVMTVKPGTILETWTEDCYDGAVRKPTDLPSKVAPIGHDNPQTGPFAVEGAEPGDILAVHIIELQPARPYAISSSFPGFGALSGTDYTALLHEPLPEKVWWYEVDKKNSTVKYKSLVGSFTFDIPMSPFLGCIGTAPQRDEVRWTVVPEQFGGNMDTWEARKGTTVYLPVNVKGGMLYFGDGHLAQGAGEIIGTAVESALEVKLEVDLIKGKSISWPRMEDDSYLMTVGSYRPLEDAARIAFKELVMWLSQDFGFDLHDAYQLVSQVAQANLTQIVDPNYTIVAKFPKKYLPSGMKAYGGIHESLSR
jgi:amidase